ncbi:MAG: hypothetical protein CBC84_000140 [Pelagibacteraceae bacterium TMED124]|nr:MAG: hypothetical protein CBC84_000140 [Pelagibacteraceae bacterium TMED124]|tara:strand:+ start:3346 stop:4335 length:990 start_codon:yes stop_codon:yes gene_type:complete
MKKINIALCIIHRPTHFHIVQNALNNFDIKKIVYITDNKSCLMYLKLLKINNVLFFSLPTFSKIITNPLLIIFYTVLFFIFRFLLNIFNNFISVFLTHDYNSLSVLFASKDNYYFIQDGLGLESSINNYNSVAYKKSKICFLSPNLYYGKYAKEIWLRTSSKLKNKKFFKTSKIHFYDEKSLFNKKVLSSNKLEKNLKYPPKNSIIFLGCNLEIDQSNLLIKFYKKISKLSGKRNFYYKPHPSGDDTANISSLSKKLIPHYIPIELFDISEKNYIFISLYSSSSFIYNQHLILLNYESMYDDRVMISKAEFDDKLNQFLITNHHILNLN